MYKEAAASVGTAAAAKHAQLAEVARRLRREHTALKQHNHVSLRAVMQPLRGCCGRASVLMSLCLPFPLRGLLNPSL